MTIAAVTETDFALAHQVRHVFRRENGVGGAAKHFLSFVAAQTGDGFIGEDDAHLGIDNNDTLIEGFEDGFHGAEPFRRRTARVVRRGEGAVGRDVFVHGEEQNEPFRIERQD